MICDICKKEILEGQIKVPRRNDDETDGQAHRDCENNTNPYMKWNKDGTDAYLTFKGQWMSTFKYLIFGIVLLVNWISGGKFEDKSPITQRGKGN